MNTLAATATPRIDQHRLTEIYDQYSPAIYRYSYRQLGDQDQAEECVAETFSRFLKVVRDGRIPDNIQAYLYRVAHNWITDTYRRGPRFEPLDTELHASPDENPAHSVADSLEQERVRRALYNLPPEQRQVIVLRFLEELSHDEAAQILGKSAEATRALQHRALAALRRMLLEQE